MLSAQWQEFSTSSVPAPQRVRKWVEFGSDTLCEMVVNPLDRHPFQATLQRVELGPMGLIFMETTPAAALSTASQVGGWAAPDRDALVMTVVDHGGCTLSQGKWSVELAEGDIVIRDLAKPWRNLSPAGSGLILVKIPFASVLKTVSDPERIIGQRLAAGDAPVAFATSVIRASRRALLTDPAGEWYDLLADILSDVFRLLCDGTAPRDGSTHEAAGTLALRRDAIGYILRNLNDPELNVGQVAESVGVSLRHLQRMFLTMGKTPRQFILDQRLERAAERIAAACDRGGVRITDIAFEVGFNDVSHFSRAFSRQYGCAPRLYRRSRH